MHKGFKSILTLFLLLYFVGVIVTPVSAICPADEAKFYENNYLFKKHRSQTDLFMFDMAYWVMLKNTKHSYTINDALIINEKATTPDAITIAILLGLTEYFREVVSIPKVTEYNDIIFKSAHSFPRSTHSGLSPPFHS